MKLTSAADLVATTQTVDESRYEAFAYSVMTQVAMVASNGEGGTLYFLHGRKDEHVKKIVHTLHAAGYAVEASLSCLSIVWSRLDEAVG